MCSEYEWTLILFSSREHAKDFYLRPYEKGKFLKMESEGICHFTFVVLLIVCCLNNRQHLISHYKDMLLLVTVDNATSLLVK